MLPRKKTALWTAGILAIAIGAGYKLIDYAFSGMCSKTVFDEIASPNRKLKAVVFQVDCGATSDFNTQVAVVKASFNRSHANALPKGFFVADRDHGRVPAGITKGPEVRLHWESDELLKVEYPQLARVFRSEEKQRGVTIQYQPFQ